MRINGREDINVIFFFHVIIWTISMNPIRIHFHIKSGTNNRNGGVSILLNVSRITKAKVLLSNKGIDGNDVSIEGWGDISEVLLHTVIEVGITVRKVSLSVSVWRSGTAVDFERDIEVVNVHVENSSTLNAEVGSIRILTVVNSTRNNVGIRLVRDIISVSKIYKEGGRNALNVENFPRSVQDAFIFPVSAFEGKGQRNAVNGVLVDTVVRDNVAQRMGDRVKDVLMRKGKDVRIFLEDEEINGHGSNKVVDVVHGVRFQAVNVRGIDVTVTEGHIIYGDKGQGV